MVNSEARVQSSTGPFGSLRRWYAGRKRLRRSRRKSSVRFRLTREGANLVFVVCFIFLGAVLRDISLLILIGAAMIGLILLQWRFNITTVSGLTAKRRVMHRTTQGSKIQCSLTIRNPKRWVGAWLVIAEDNIQQLAPGNSKTATRGKAIIDEILPESESSGTYHLTFHERGLYRIGPCTLATRFPLGLGRGWRVQEEIDEIIVHPKQGTIQPAFKSLLQNSRDGHHRSSSHVGVHEADFFGLRPWASGDSKRWIHWRTTARLGELSVRQFDRLEQQQSCVLLDLYRAPGEISSAQKDACERAIAFIATVVQHAAMSHDTKLAVAIAADSEFSLSGIQSNVLGNAMLDKLAVISPSPNPNLTAALQRMTQDLLANPHLIVVSTRSQAIESLQKSFSSLLGPKATSRLHIHWLDVTQGDLDKYFSWTFKE